MKKILLLLGISSYCFAQNSEMSFQKMQTRKVIADSVVRNVDSVYISRFKSPAARISDLKTNALNANTISATQINATNASLNFLNVVNSAQFYSFSSPSGSIGELSLQTAVNANPVFGNQNGKLGKESNTQYLSIPAVAFIPEKISPLSAPQSNLAIGGIRRIVNNGEVEGQSLANDHMFKLVAPLVFPLNNADKNIIFEDAKICTYDKENPRDLVAVIYEVNSSDGQFPLIVNPKMVFRSKGNNASYKCFDLSDGAGKPFEIDGANNSYYLAVYPVAATATSEQILKDPELYIAPWVASDNPYLRLVHFIGAYKYQ
jgi:hypothetical protein